MFLSLKNKSVVFLKVRVFFSWWGSELAALIPGFVKRAFQADYYQLHLNLAAGKVRLVDVLENHVVEEFELDTRSPSLPAGLTDAIARLNQVHIETVLILNPDDVLFLDVNLPAEAEENLHNILGYEMDRQTPFHADQVYYDHQVKKAPNDPAHILVKLVVAPRELVKKWLKHFQTSGFSPAIVTLPLDNTSNNKADPAINLLPAELRLNQPMGLAAVNYLLIVTVVIMIFIAAYLAIHRQNSQIDQLKGEIASVSGDVQEVQKLKKQINQLITKSGEIVERKQQSASNIATLNELSLLIPDHTWINRLELNGTRVNLEGNSENPSELIGILESSGSFEDVTFASPVIRDAKSGRCRFKIMANLSPHEKTP